MLLSSNVDHYAHIADIGPFIFYEPPVTEALIDMIDEWLNGGA